MLRFGAWRLRPTAWAGLGVVVDGLVHDQPEVAAPADYVGDVLLAPAHRDAFFALIDHAGLVVCRNVGGDDASHAEVRGRSSRGRLRSSGRAWRGPVVVSRAARARPASA